MKEQLRFKKEFRNVSGDTGALWVRIRGNWFSIVDGKKKYEELPVSLSERTKLIGKPTTAAKIKLLQLDTLIVQLNAVATAEKRQISKEELKARLVDEGIAKFRTVQGITANEVVNDGTVSKVVGQYIEEKGQHVSQNYLKIYKTLQYYFERYDAANVKSLTFHSFDRETYKKFWAWQNDVYKGKIQIEKHGRGKGRTDANGFTPDSLRKYQKAFYQIAEYAQHLGIATALQNTRYERKLLIKPKAQAETKKYLTVEEIHKILNYAPTSAAMATARQFLIISCLTGQRFETMQTLDRMKVMQHRTGFAYASVFYNKTKVDVVLPLFPQVLSVLDNGQFPTFDSNVVINRDIKKVCEIVGIQGWQEVTTHTGKRSFYSNLAAADVPATIIELITHPKRKETAMQAVYDNRQAMTRAEQFYKYLNTVDTHDMYSFTPVGQSVDKVVEMFEYH